MPKSDGLLTELLSGPYGQRQFLVTVAKHILLFLVMLAVSNFIVISCHTDSISIYIQPKSKPDFIQLFVKHESNYSERDSVTVRVSGDNSGRIVLPIPYPSTAEYRLDLGDKPIEIVIEKIELKNILGVITYEPSDIIAHSKPIQMIDKFQLGDAGLIVHSTGNDSAFEFLPKKPPFFEENAKEIVSFVLALIAYLGFIAYRKLSSFSSEKRFLVVLVPLIASLSIVALFYPGFMSYDTLHALYGARDGVTDSMWPPMVSYVWRAVDVISLNPSAMHFAQVFLLFLSVSIIIFLFTRNFIYITAFFLIYLSIPVVLGTISVIWKDVLMAAFFVAGIASVECLRLAKNRLWITSLLLLAVFFIFLAICSRHNAITAAVPLFCYLALIFGLKMFDTRVNVCLFAVIFGSLLVGTSFLAKSFLDNYSLPNFHKINNSNEFFIRSVQALDLAGASECVGKNLFGEIAPDLILSDIYNEYDPRHINLSRKLLSRISDDDGVIDARVSRVWLNTAFNHPICFWSHKFDLTKYLVGANYGPQYIITQPTIDENRYGYKLSPSTLRDSVVTYIVQESDLPFFRPWFLYLLSVIALIYLARSGNLRAGYLAIFLSGWFYFGSLVLFGNAADARLPFYSTTVLLLFVVLVFSEFRRRCRHAGG